eukprot:TRINITY_DN11645_c0_g1_i1.p1 TRINITY_DN11645_c0_g1~~TRINITY_DN11645_c0_g1_i1.p1  ORF type:complete len:468 (+),score=192.80 TRINITY_DN11645_c0_g1_i1:115-1404(+)
MELDFDDDKKEITAPTREEIKIIAKLSHGKTLKTLLEKIDEQIAKGERKIIGSFENDPEYEVIVEANNHSVLISDEIARVHKYINDRYSEKFSDLATIIQNPIDYAKSVLRLGNESDVQKVDLSDILPTQLVMVINITGATPRVPLSEDKMKEVEEACNIVISLDESRQKIVSYVESRMNKVAPNLSTLVGTSVAAKLMSVAGGLQALSKLPAGTIQCLGRVGKNSLGFSNNGMTKHIGVIKESNIIAKCPKIYKTRALRLVVGKTALCARADSFHGSSDIGENYKYQIEKQLEKLQEPPAPKAPKALPAPSEGPRKRRAGKRITQFRSKYKMTEMAKQANRMAFGVEEQTIGNSFKSIGMLANTSSKVKIVAQDKGILPKKQKVFNSGGQTSGLSSSLAFSSTSEMLLVAAPDRKKDIAEINNRYFKK